jgi:hypothetical protein
MQDKKVIGAVAGLTILGSGLGIAFCLTGGFGPGINASLHQAIGRALAQQTLSLLKPGGDVVVITRDTATFQNPATDIAFATFRNELQKAGVKILSIEPIQVDPLRPVAVPAGDFLQWIKKGSKGSVIASLMGPPVFTEAQLAQLGEIKPAIVAFCSGPVRDHVDLKSLFTEGLLKGAVVSKHPLKNSQAADQRDLFEQNFAVITPGNLAELPATTSPAP